MKMEDSWILEIVKTLIPFLGGILGGIGTVIFAEKRKRKNRHLRIFTSAVSSEIGRLNNKGDDLDGREPLWEWHLESIHRLKPHVDFMKNFDQKRWEKIEPSYNEYRSPTDAPKSDGERRVSEEKIDKGFYLDKLLKLLNSIRKV